MTEAEVVDKGKTERRILEALKNEPGWRLVRINWKKGCKLHLRNGFGRLKIVQLH
jgi:hypothetical protein